jgi:isoleucyl-tRNA synthetase
MATLSIGAGTVEIMPGDIIVSESPREGWAVSSDSEDSVAIDLHIDDDLRRAGLAREIVRAIQEARKGAGLEITDRINVFWNTEDPDIQATFSDHGSEIAGEVLSLSLTHENHSASYQVATDLPVSIGIERA